MSLGDRRVAPAIEAAERNGGNWRAAVAETGVDADFYIFRDRSGDAVLPWDIIDGGMKQSFFRAEFDKGLREEWTLPPKRQQRTRSSCRCLQLAPLAGARSAAPRVRVYSDHASSDQDATATSASCSCVGLQDQIAQPLLRGGVGIGRSSAKTAPLAVDRVLARRERHVAAVAGLALPHREANQLEAFERSRR